MCLVLQLTPTTRLSYFYVFYYHRLIGFLLSTPNSGREDTVRCRQQQSNESVIVQNLVQIKNIDCEGEISSKSANVICFLEIMHEMALFLFLIYEKLW